MNTTIEYGNQGRYQLSRAVLIYELQRNADWSGSSLPNVAATTHAIKFYDGKPLIEAGTPVTLDAIQSLTRQIGGNVQAQFLPETVLSHAFDALAWWCPASRHRIWFRYHDNDKDGKILKACNGREAHHPPLLFVARRRQLHVFALPGNKRPRPETPLLRAPYYNLSEDGHLCIGSARIPERPSPARLSQYEQGFFNSAFTHSNVHGDKLTLHPGGHAGLWKAACTLSEAPDDGWWQRHLVPLKTSVIRAIQQ